MHTLIYIGDLPILVHRKDVKNVHLTAHPPNGNLTLTAPMETKLETVRSFAASKIPWIRKQQERFKGLIVEAPRQFIERESHYVWGKVHLLTIVYKDEKPSISYGHKLITLTIRRDSTRQTRDTVFRAWHKSLLHKEIPKLVNKWEGVLNIKLGGYSIQHMKTRWGSCNRGTKHIRLNTELAKKSKAALEYVVVHEMLHLIEPNHTKRFAGLMELYLPNWRITREGLNRLPIESGSECE